MAKDTEAEKVKTAYEGQQTATVDLDSARIIRGTAYGPGKGIKVPKSVADAIKAEDSQPTKKQGKGKQKSE